MIFFTETFEPYQLEDGSDLTPIDCELKDGRSGYYLSDKWKEAIEGRGITTEPITFDDIKQPEIE